jgi:hypothetical protein
MKTFRQWLKEEKELRADQYGVPQSHIDYLTNYDWFNLHIKPKMQLGIRPSIAVAKSLAKHCPLSPAQLCRLFLSYGHGDNFWPVGYDLKGIKIK